MKKYTLLWAGALVLVSACSNKDELAGGAGGLAPSLNGGNAAGGFAGSADPSSVAYFNQTVGDRVLFEVDSSSLTGQGQATLTAQAGWLSRNPDYQIIVEGHADEQGTREYNLALGARRANAVREFLISQGISASRLKTVSYGKERPVELCADESCYRQNRRAVSIISVSSLS